MDSPLITMEMEGWEIDSIASFGMAMFSFFRFWPPFPWFRPITPYLDQIITVTLSIFMPDADKDGNTDFGICS